jgi:ribonuclease HI
MGGILRARAGTTIEQSRARRVVGAGSRWWSCGIRLMLGAMSGRREYLCYTDGSCKAADGAPGGWGFCIKPPRGAPSIEAHGMATETLAKIMEYQAVAEALGALPDEGASVVVFSDNASLVENLEKRLGTWRANGFAKVDSEIVESARRIDAAITTKRLTVRFQWVRAHNGNAGNERADALAREGAREAKAGLANRAKGQR